MNTGRTITTTTVALAVILTTALTATAQDRRPGPGWEGDRPPAEGMAKQRGPRRGPGGMSREQRLLHMLARPEALEKLDLSQKQKEKLTDALMEIRKEQIQLEAKQKIAAMEQVRLMTADKIDEDKVMEAVEKTGELHTRLAKLRARSVIVLKNTLTPEQIEAAGDALRNRFRSHRERFERMRDRSRRREGGDRPGRREGDRGRGRSAPEEE